MSVCQYKHLTTKYVLLCFSSIIFFSIIVNIMPNGFSVFRNVNFAFAKHKINQKNETEASQIIDVSPPGPMMSPMRMSSIIPLLSPDHPQIVVRGFELIQEAVLHGERRLAESRLRAIDFISGNSRDGLHDFLSVLKLNLSTVVIAKNLPDQIQVDHLLMDNNYELRNKTDSYLIYVKRNQRMALNDFF